MLKSEVDCKRTRNAGRIALITGGGSRIGSAIAREFAAAGMDIALTYTHGAARAAGVADMVEQLGRRCVLIESDFTADDAVAHVYSAFCRHYDRLDILVNNASIFAETPAQHLTLTECERFLRVNASTPLLLITQFMDLLGSRFSCSDPDSPGRVINFVDMHVLGEPLPGFSAYNASKAALLELTRTLAVELAPGITVNAIAPGVVGWAEFHSENYKAEFLRRVPLGREGTPAEVAKAVLFLADEATYCSGQVIRLDGGRLLT